MEESLRRVLLCCALNCVVHVLSMENDRSQWTDQELLWRVNLYRRAILLHQDHVQKVQRENPDCVYNSTRNYENMNQITHRWKLRSSNASKNLHSLHKSMEENANSDLGILVQEINYLRDCLSGKVSYIILSPSRVLKILFLQENKNNNTSKPLPSEAEWAQQVAEVKTNLDATKKINEFYVMVENAKLAHKTNCSNEFSPLATDLMHPLARQLSLFFF
ncbi:uncharacterized protein LOC128992866 [Macrosteles quadrilineatus]|uniref:uncharacterized protein LOC128992866 n=1 Tax=Macrosteles quadrilineatus TaxID=74068 RepID=UPI0023E290D2|nr:uncharacterized protein LOC128992866 [Macrosteles quadrilineatus]